MAQEIINATDTLDVGRGKINNNFTELYALSVTPARRLFYKRTVSTAVSGSASEQLCDSILVPANTFQANDIVFFRWTWTKTGTVANCITRIRCGSSNDLSGTQIATATSPAANTLYNQCARKLTFKNSLSSQEIFPTSVSAFTDDFFNGSTTAISSLSIDFSQAQYFVISFSGDSSTITLRDWTIEIMR